MENPYQTPLETDEDGANETPPRQPPSIYAIGTAVMVLVAGLAMFQGEWFLAVCVLMAAGALNVFGWMVDGHE